MDKKKLSIDTVRRAHQLAVWAHDGQFYNEEPYINHVQRVVNNVYAHKDSHNIFAKAAVAWLHDVVEDSSITQGVIDKEFPEEVARAVSYITRDLDKWWTDETYMGYIKRVKKNELATSVKLKDIKDNVKSCNNDLDNWYKHLLKYQKATVELRRE